MTARDAELRQIIEGRITEVLTDAHFPEFANFGRGKVRDIYDLAPDRRIMITTDRQSAFDQVLAAVPFKGQVLTDIARFWFEATADIIPNHVISYPDPNIMIVRRMTMLPIEVVVRDYLTGSTSTAVWPMYRDGKRNMYGVDFPEGLVKNSKLPATILTPTTKGGEGAHDVPISPAEIVTQELLTADQWQKVEKKALALFARGREIAVKQGLILVDTKYEFGFDPITGSLTLADEVHTPDSSRYWLADSYDRRMAAGEEPDSLDKEFLRLWIASRCDPYKDPIPEIPAATLADFSARYIALYERISDKVFALPPASPPIRERIHLCLQKIEQG